MGISFMGVGVVFLLAVNTILGIALLAAGMGNMLVGLSGLGSNNGH